MKTNILQTVTTKKPRKKLSLAAQKTAAKVQLMKLKMKSVGQGGLPEGERVYFLVHPPQVGKILYLILVL